MVLLQLIDPLELFVKRKEFLPGSGFPSRCDMAQAVESDVKTHSMNNLTSRPENLDNFNVVI